jgi:Cu/Ag efflux protein CusF
MLKFVVLSVALVTAASVPAFAQKPEATGGTVMETSPGKGTVASVAKITASVEAIDAAKRTITLKGPEGNVVTITAGPEVKNFDQIKVGDFLVVRYVEALTLELKKGGTALRQRTDRDMGVAAKPGERPAGAVGTKTTVIADVIALDPKKQVVTLRGPERTVDLKLRDPEQFKLVKVGDQVEATFTEAAAISVEPAPKPAGKK